MSKNMIWITGADGHVGTALHKVLPEHGYHVLCTNKEDVDVTDMDAVRLYAEMNRPTVIINCAALTNPSECEANPEEAYKVNAIGARNLSIAARKCGAKMVQISTDDVFDGLSDKPYNEFDVTNPRTVYGKSKCAGEGYVKEFTQRHFIIRSTWVYGEGYNFVNKFIEETKNKGEVTVASDQFGSPTSAEELAKFILHIMTTGEYGTYHATCKGVCSRFELAEKIAEILGRDVKIHPVPSKDNEFSSFRPAYGVLDNFIMSIVDVYDFADWESALAKYLGGIKESGK